MNIQEHRLALARFAKEALAQQQNADNRGDTAQADALGDYADELSQASIKLSVAEAEGA